MNNIRIERIKNSDAYKCVDCGKTKGFDTEFPSSYGNRYIPKCRKSTVERSAFLLAMQHECDVGPDIIPINKYLIKTQRLLNKKNLWKKGEFKIGDFDIINTPGLITPELHYRGRMVYGNSSFYFDDGIKNKDWVPVFNRTIKNFKLR